MEETSNELSGMWKIKNRRDRAKTPESTSSFTYGSFVGGATRETAAENKSAEVGEAPDKKHSPAISSQSAQRIAKTAPKRGLISIPEGKNRTMLFPNSASSPSLYSSRAAADVKKQKEKNTVFGHTRRG